MEIRSWSGLRSDYGSFYNHSGTSKGPGFGKTRVSLGCFRPLQGGPIGCSSPRAPLKGSSRVVPSGSLYTRTRGVVPRYPRRGVLREWSRTVPGSFRGRVTPDWGFSPQARRRGFRISWDHQEVWRRPPVSRPQFLAAEPT